MNAVLPQQLKAMGMAVLATLALAAGCTSKATARAQAQAAFYAGQAQARAQQQKPVITVIGNVAHPTVEWTEGLTLVRLLIQAEWLGRNDPRRIVVRRPDGTLNVDPRQLLREGTEGPELQPGDVVELQP